MWFQDSRETGNMPEPFSPDRPHLQNANLIAIEKQGMYGFETIGVPEREFPTFA
jgi:hypothetical protein